MKKRFFNTLMLGIMTLSFSSCEPSYWDEGFGEDMLTIYDNGEYTTRVWNYAERDYYYFIAALSSAPNRFLYISMHSRSPESRPSYYIYDLLPIDEALQEVAWQNANTKGHNFSTNIEPCVYEGQCCWRSRCSRTNAVLLIRNYGSDRSIIRADYFWGTWNVRHDFISSHAFQLWQYGSYRKWNFQIRPRSY